MHTRSRDSETLSVRAIETFSALCEGYQDLPSSRRVLSRPCDRPYQGSARAVKTFGALAENYRHLWSTRRELSRPLELLPRAIESRIPSQTRSFLRRPQEQGRTHHGEGLSAAHQHKSGPHRPLVKDVGRFNKCRINYHLLAV